MLSNVDEIGLTATCAICGPTPVARQVMRQTGRSEYLVTRCLTAKRGLSRSQTEYRIRFRAKLHAEQDGCCAICGSGVELGERSSGTGVVDHDHESGLIRALLCKDCNTGIGHLKDNPDILRAAADYIEKQAARTDDRLSFATYVMPTKAVRDAL